MANYHLVTFDPGAAATGWAHLVVDERAFTRPANKVLRNLKDWNCGEFTGPEVAQLDEARRLIWRARGFEQFEHNRCDVVSEDFELTQLIGGKNLLSPVRINAVIDWLCQTQFGLKLELQRRTMRTSVTPERLRAFGFERKWTKTGRGKDEFAAMQHAIVWLRRLKERSRSHPWKMTIDGTRNARWDCSCQRGWKTCDLDHPT